MNLFLIQSRSWNNLFAGIRAIVVKVLKWFTSDASEKAQVKDDVFTPILAIAEGVYMA